MGALDVLKDSAMALVFIGILVGAGAIALVSFQNTQITGATACGTNSTGGSGGTILYDACGYAYNITLDASTGLSNSTGFLPTIGTLVGVAALVAVVVGGLYFVYRG